MQIAHQHILITGATGGIGRAFAMMCAREGAHLHLVCRKTDESFLDDLKLAGALSVTVWSTDLSHRDDVQALCQKLSSQRIDILFNNAGLLTGGLLEDQPLSDIYSMVQVNLTALIYLTHSILPGMLNRKHGKIINNSSVSAVMAFPCASTYGASKAAVASFTRSLDLELTGSGVTTLLLITPGIKTPMFDQIAPLYEKNLEVPDQAMRPEIYAQKIKHAIERDHRTFTPSLFSLEGLGLFTTKFFFPIYKFFVLTKFKRT
jgi:uncharacterized protein